MFLFTMLMLFFFILSLTLIFVSILVSLKSMMDREKTSPFECGFEPKNSPRTPFSIHVFMVAIIFLIFGVEITILIPIPLTLFISNNYFMMFLSSSFIIILLMGLYYEWLMGSLKWNY